MSWLRDTVLRLLPHATNVGLRAIGHPGAQAPVLVTGNYTLTVSRLERALRGRDVWLLVCNSRGINVWCAATGGHFTDGDVIAAIRASGLAQRVEHHRLVLPQLAATGIEPATIERATGFVGRWGPARLEDLPAFLDRGGHVTRAQRKMRFPLWERLEMAVMWAVPLAAIALGVGWLALGLAVGLVLAGLVLLQVFGIFAASPKLPLTGAKRWLTYGGAAVLGAGLGLAALAPLGFTIGGVVAVSAAACGAMALLSVDLAGTTPWFPGTINSIGNHFDLELVEDRCTGAAACVQVCPRDVLHMDGKRRKVAVVQPDACVRCGACIVQCPEDALQFRFDDGHVVPAATVRSTRVNMLGRRTVAVEEGAARA
ncbi:MAG: 4Fe-4S binding protein [Myxococcales bacterium]|nr:4Fe-4S binding protein [Myxococcales bacterium]